MISSRNQEIFPPRVGERRGIEEEMNRSMVWKGIYFKHVQFSNQGEVFFWDKLVILKVHWKIDMIFHEKNLKNQPNFWQQKNLKIFYWKFFWNL